MRKSKQKKMVRVVPKTTQKKTPFSDTGGILGHAIGNMFNNGGIGRNVGKWLGSGIGSIFGSGDYTLTGPTPEYNVLTSSKQIPQFKTNTTGTIITHREYLSDISGTAAFANTRYVLNPGESETFPWLSTIAECYQEYKFHGLIFEFRPLTTDFANAGVPGVVIMSTNYNSLTANYTSKQQMENAEFAVSCKPTQTVIHGVECATGQTVSPLKYIRNASNSATGDPRLYDQGNFQIATQGNSPTVILGELWVSYVVEFYKPILPTTLDGGLVDFYQRNNVVNQDMFGTTQTNQKLSQIGTTIDGRVLTFPSTVSGTFKVDIYHNGTPVVTPAGIPVPTFVNCTLVAPMFSNNSLSAIAAPLGLNSGLYISSFYVRVNPDLVAATCTYAATIVPTASNIDVVITSCTGLVQI